MVCDRVAFDLVEWKAVASKVWSCSSRRPKQSACDPNPSSASRTNSGHNADAEQTSSSKKRRTLDRSMPPPEPDEPPAWIKHPDDHPEQAEARRISSAKSKSLKPGRNEASSASRGKGDGKETKLPEQFKGEVYGSWTHKESSLGKPSYRGPQPDVHLGTPCNTYSSEGLSQKEKEDLKEGNIHTIFSGEVMDTSVSSLTPFTLENPEPQNDVTIFKTPVVEPFMKRREASMANFDQCRYGCEATKPTRLLASQMRHSWR